jgi:sugar phosphate isomerase/epimerase
MGRDWRTEETSDEDDQRDPHFFLAQFAGDRALFNALDSITKWAAGLGYKGVQIPSWDGRFFDLKQAAESRAYCDDLKGTLEKNGVQLTELSTTSRDSWSPDMKAGQSWSGSAA